MMDRLYSILGTAFLAAAAVGTGTAAVGVLGRDAAGETGGIRPAPVAASQTEGSPAGQEGGPARGAGMSNPYPPDYYAAITDRPLFAPDRRPHPPEPAPAAPARAEIAAPAVQDLPVLDLLGIVQTGDTRRALIAAPGQPADWMTEASTIGDWELSRIGPTWIEIKNNEKTQRLDLFK